MYIQADIVFVLMRVHMNLNYLLLWVYLCNFCSSQLLLLVCCFLYVSLALVRCSAIVLLYNPLYGDVQCDMVCGSWGYV